MTDNPPKSEKDSTTSKPVWAQLATYAAAVGLLAVGVGAFVYMALTRQLPEGQPTEDPGRLVRAFEAHPADHRVAVTAYGTSQAAMEWTAIAEVEGRAVHVSEEFEPGAFLGSGSLIVKIDPTDYELAVRRFRADVESRQLALNELDQTEENTEEILQLQERQLVIYERELKRVRGLFEAGQAPQTELDSVENAYVSQRTAVQNSRNALNLIPVQRKQLKASLELAEAQLEQARRDLERTEIRLPIPARCATKQVEADQYVPRGTQLGTFYSRNQAEVQVVLEPRQLNSLLPDAEHLFPVMDLSERSIAFEEFTDRFFVPAAINWVSGMTDVTWRGRVQRLSSALTRETQTIIATVVVDDPYKNVQPGVRPPFIPGVFCRVTLYGTTLNDAFVIPREALRDERVYLMRDGKLHIRRVEVAVLEENKAVIRSGIESGDLVVLADLFPAVQGMPLRVDVVPNPVSARPPGTIGRDLTRPEPMTQPSEAAGAGA
jgi:RND family efflux transporter MFP subunit